MLSCFDYDGLQTSSNPLEFEIEKKKMFQYITCESKGLLEEIWACENCRKMNNYQILIGEWRLIDKRENVNFACDNCRVMQRDAEQQILYDNWQEGKTPFL